MKDWTPMERDFWGNFNGEGGILCKLDLSKPELMKLVGGLMANLAFDYPQFKVSASIQGHRNDARLVVRLTPEEGISYDEACKKMDLAAAYYRGMRDGSGCSFIYGVDDQ